ncbi:MAG: hypothetical protein U5R49_12225 [Deltaproteobacteria bacterium]|nr:hypothetical protein [Deltaproteobacteria bacterium]
MDLHQELVDFKNELLHVAKLPYKPNLNDGLIIIGAPLWRLFRHKPWQKGFESLLRNMRQFYLVFAKRSAARSALTRKKRNPGHSFNSQMTFRVNQKIPGTYINEPWQIHGRWIGPGMRNPRLSTRSMP